MLLSLGYLNVIYTMQNDHFIDQVEKLDTLRRIMSLCN